MKIKKRDTCSREDDLTALVIENAMGVFCMN